MAQKWTDLSSATTTDRLSSGIDNGICQLSDGTLVFIDYDGTNRYLKYSSDRSTINTIATVSATFVGGIGLCRDASNNLYLVGANSAFHPTIQAFTKGTGYSWTAQTVLTYTSWTLGTATTGSATAVWCNTGGGTGNAGHIASTICNNAGSSNGGIIFDAGIALTSGSASSVVTATNGPPGNNAAACDIEVDGFGATSGLAASAYTSGGNARITGFTVSSAGAWSTTLINASYGSGVTSTRVRVIRYGSNAFAVVTNGTTSGHYGIGCFSASAALIAEADSGAPTNLALNGAGLGWDVYKDPTQAKIWVIAQGASANVYRAGAVITSSITWDTAATLSDTMSPWFAQGTAHVRAVKSISAGGAVVDWQVMAETASGTYALLGDYDAFYTAPSAPTLSSPANSSYQDVSSGLTFSATYNSTDGQNQNAYAMRIKLSGGSYNYYNAGTNSLQSSIVWNSDSIAPSGSFSVTLPNTAISDGHIYNWSMASQEAGANLQGGFASDFTLNTQAVPTLVVNNPSGTVVTAMPTIFWTTTPASGATQTQYRVVIYTQAQYSIGGFTPGTSPSTWDSGTLSGTAQSLQVGAALTNSTTWRAYVQVTETGGQTSAWAFISFTTQFDAPAVPNLTAAASTDPATGYPVVALTVQGNDNLLTAADSSFEPGVGNWTGAGGNCTVAQSSAHSLDGSFSLAVTTTANGTANAYNGTATVPVVAGQSYTAIVSFRAAATPRQVQVAISFNNGGGTVSGSVFADNTTGWVQAQVRATCPAGSTAANIAVYILNSATSEVHYIDCASLALSTVPGEPQWAGINPNLLTNGDFEQDTTGTGALNSSLSQSDVQAYTGLKSLLVTATSVQSPRAQGVQFSSMLAANTTYTVSAWVYLPSSGGFNGGIEWAINDPGGGPAGTSAAVTTTDQWTRLVFTFTTTSGGAWGVYITNAGVTANGQEFYVDAVKVEVGSTATQFVPPSYSNLQVNPSFEVDATGWGTTGGVAIARSTAQAYVGTASLAATNGASALAGGQKLTSSTNSSVGSAGTYTVSAWVLCPVGSSLYIGLENIVAGGVDHPGTGQWQRISQTINIGNPYNGSYFGNNTGALISAGLSGVAANAVVYIDAVQIEIGNQANPFIDGSQVGGSWDVANNLLTAPTSSFEDGSTGGWIINGGSGTGATVANSTAQAKDGTHSLLFTVGTGSVGSNVAGPQQVVSTVPGATYTLSLWLYQPALVGSGLHATVYSPLIGQIDAPAVTVTGAWVRSTLTFTAKEASTNIYCIASGIPANGSTFYIDAIQVEQREYATQYGQAATANASSSTYQFPWSLGGFAGNTSAYILRSDGLYVRNASTGTPLAIPAGTQLATVLDYEAIPTVNYTYTAYVEQASTGLVSAPSSATSAVVLNTTKWWEIDPTNPSSAVAAQPVEWNPQTGEQSAAHLAMGANTQTIIANVMMAQDGTGSFETFDAATYAGLHALLLSQKVVFLSDPWGPAGWGSNGPYVRFGPQGGGAGFASSSGNKIKNTRLLPSSASGPHRTTDVTWIAQPRPAV